MTIDNKVIKVLEKYYINDRMPADLKVYLFNRYSSEPIPYEWSEQDLYSNIKEDVMAYYNGSLDLTIKTPEELLKDDLDSALNAYGEAMHENNEQYEEIKLLQSFIHYHNLEDLFVAYKENPQPAAVPDGELLFM